MKQLDELLKKKFKDFSGYVLMAEKSKMDRPQLVKDYEAALNGLVDETKQAIQALIEEEKTKARINELGRIFKHDDLTKDSYVALNEIEDYLDERFKELKGE